MPNEQLTYFDHADLLGHHAKSQIEPLQFDQATA
jgi:hypothetical protein